LSKEILLISPPYPPEGRKPVPPLGIASIAGYLEENGYRGKVELADGFYLAEKHGYRESLRMLAATIEKEKPFVVGCSVLHTNEDEANEIMRSAKKTGSHIIVGSHRATADHESYSRLVTAVVRGEGEITTKELMDALFKGKALREIDGITFLDNGKVVVNPDRRLADLNELPPPAFHLLPPASDYDSLPVEESRGCCFKCSFCSIAEMYPSYRLKSPRRIRSEVQRIVGLGIKSIKLIGELVLLDENRALEIADMMSEFGCNWKMDGHPTLVIKQKKILPILAEKGLKVIEMGVESGNQNSLNLYAKQTTPRISQEAIDLVLASGIFPLIDFINFEPYLTMKDLEDNIRFIMRNLRLLSEAPSYPLENIFKPWIPIPGTPLFEKATKEKLVISIEKTDTTSYLKMRNAQHYFIFRDNKVKRVTDIIDYFVKRYGERYYQMLGEVVTEESLLSQSPKAVALAIIPAYILCMAYALVENDVYAGGVVDWYCQQRLDAIERGDYEDNLSPSPVSAENWERILKIFKKLAPSTK